MSNDALARFCQWWESSGFDPAHRTGAFLAWSNLQHQLGEVAASCQHIAYCNEASAVTEAKLSIANEIFSIVGANE